MVMSLLYITQQLTIYGGFIFLVAGIIGNGINIFIFSTVRTYRTAPCSFYFLVGSIANFLYIVINLSSRIVSVGYGIDLTRTSVVWCKARQFFIITLGLISLSCSCLATIDQYFATSQNVTLRRYRKIEWAHRIVFVVIIVWCLHGISPLVFYYISPTSGMCEIWNPGFAAYLPIYILVLLFAIPVVVLIVFGSLTYRNIRQTMVLAEQRADRQLARMTLIQIVLVVISIIPYGIYIVYTVITAGEARDANRQLKEYFVATFFSLISYFYYTVCLFIFCHTNSKLFLGKFLRVLDFIKSLSSDSEKPNTPMPKIKSNKTI